MTHEDFFDRVEALLGPLGSRPDDGEEYREPPLDVLRYQLRAVRMHWFPVLGRALSVVAIVRQPPDLPADAAGHRRLLDRLARAVHGRYPPWPKGGPGLTIGLTAVVLTAGPIGPDEEDAMAGALVVDRRSRALPMGLLRVDLDREALAQALGPAPRDLFPEPFALADGLSEALGRFVPPLEF